MVVIDRYPFAVRDADTPKPSILLWQCLDEIQQQYDALMAEGILPASPPMSKSPVRAKASHLSHLSPGAVEVTSSAASTLMAEGVSVGDSGKTGEGTTATANTATGAAVVGEGEPDADLDLDDDGTR